MPTWYAFVVVSTFLHLIVDKGSGFVYIIGIKGDSMEGIETMDQAELEASYEERYCSGELTESEMEQA